MKRNFKKLSICHIDILKRFCRLHQPSISEINAVNLFIWKDYYDYHWNIIDGYLIIIGKKKDGSFFSYQPFGLRNAEKNIIKKIFDVLKYDLHSEVLQMTRVEKRFASNLNGSSGLSVIPLRNHFDYVYLIDRTVFLKGKIYETKRNEINKFHNRLNGDELFIDGFKEKYFESYLSISKKWSIENKSNDNAQIEAEYTAITNAIENADKLNLTGTTVIINGKVEAFTICDMLNYNTALIHIQKYNRSIPGICVFLTKETLLQNYSGVKYFNYEQDLGIEGLKFSKLSYRPVFLEEKYELKKM
ncbi:MAG TPA: phosphatidylglycerol lysyltransferase domain-containing protein [bacterium]|mgnify:CR=1 FL=1|nr:phosphatidylglycerol lysyltransferase domain-containing protein [bacterium]HPN31045.1 phosphatidylglycerol lysyltransferase domain-containing protein [bacterium]